MNEPTITISLKLTDNDGWITIPYNTQGYVMARQVSLRNLKEEYSFHPSFSSVQLIPTGCIDVNSQGYIAEIYVPEDRLEEWKREFQA